MLLRSSVVVLLVPLLAAAAPAPPASWVSRIAAHDLLWTPNDEAISPNNMPEIGNGLVATQVSSSSIYVSGVYNGYLTSTPSHIARLPATNAFAAPGTVVAAGLDIRNATYYRRSVLAPRKASDPACTPASSWVVSCSNAPVALTVEQRWYAHRLIPSLLVMEVEVLPFEGREPQDAGIYNCSYPLAVLAMNNNAGLPSGDLNFTSLPVPHGAGYTLVNGTTYVAETNTSGLQGVALAVSALPVVIGGSADSCPGSQPNAAVFLSSGLTWPHITAVRSSIETSPGRMAGTAASDWGLAQALAANGTLHASHIAAWEAEVWVAGYETDRADVAAVVNTSLLALQASARGDRPVAVGPGGITQGYNNHQFWDRETWQLPGIQLFYPDIAAASVLYRALRLPGAREKAASYAPPYTGAAFPWESAFTGEETCPVSAPTGLREMHIGGDIAFQIQQYWRLIAGSFNTTLHGKEALSDWLSSIGYPVLAGIADFWVSKAVIDTPGAVVAGWPRSSSPSSPSGGELPLSLCDVIPPDEYHDHTNNSVYTNAVARIALEVAAAAAQALGQPPSAWTPWVSASSRLVSLFSQDTPPGAPAGSFPGGWHPEFAGYAGDTIKQADVVLLGFPLDSPPWTGMTPTVRANDLGYYTNVTDPGGPAMTWSMFAVGYIELGQAEVAAGYFNRSFANAQPPFAVWTETPTGGAPNFLTGAGGFLQAVLFGYTGLRVREGYLAFNPSLMEGAGYYRLRGMSYAGNRLDVTVTAGAVTLEVQTPDEAAQLAAAVASADRRRYAWRGEAATSAAAQHCAATGGPGTDTDAESWRGAAAAWLACSDAAEAVLASAGRHQRGRVALPSFVEPGSGHLLAAPHRAPAAVDWVAVPAQALEVVAADGTITPLKPGVAVSLPLPQTFTVQVASA